MKLRLASALLKIVVICAIGYAIYHFTVGSLPDHANREYVMEHYGDSIRLVEQRIQAGRRINDYGLQYSPERFALHEDIIAIFKDNPEEKHGKKVDVYGRYPYTTQKTSFVVAGVGVGTVLLDEEIPCLIYLAKADTGQDHAGKNKDADGYRIFIRDTKQSK